MGFHAKLIELPVIKASEYWRQAAEHPNQRQLRRDDVNDQSEPRLLGEREAVFGFALHLWQWLTGKEKIRVQIVAHA
jgi:hypothetical protein